MYMCNGRVNHIPAEMKTVRKNVNKMMQHISLYHFINIGYPCCQKIYIYWVSLLTKEKNSRKHTNYLSIYIKMDLLGQRFKFGNLRKIMCYLIVDFKSLSKSCVMSSIIYKY